MTFHRVDHFALLAVLVEHLTSELEMRSFHLAIDGLADVVEQSAALGDRIVHAELHGHQRRELCDLERMDENVLPIRRAITQASEEFQNLGVNIGDAE